MVVNIEKETVATPLCFPIITFTEIPLCTRRSSFSDFLRRLFPPRVQQKKKHHGPQISLRQEEKTAQDNLVKVVIVIVQIIVIHVNAFIATTATTVIIVTAAKSFTCPPHGGVGICLQKVRCKRRRENLVVGTGVHDEVPRPTCHRRGGFQNDPRR